MRAHTPVMSDEAIYILGKSNCARLLADLGNHKRVLQFVKDEIALLDEFDSRQTLLLRKGYADFLGIDFPITIK